MSTNLEYRAGERQRKRESRRQASKAQINEKKGDRGENENFVAAVTKWEMLTATNSNAR